MYSQNLTLNTKLLTLNTLNYSEFTQVPGIIL